MSSSIRQKHDGHATDVKKGPWTAEEDSVLVHHVSVHGEGRWNSVARSIGLKRTGKSCRLRWLNYLRPDVRRGNISLQEQLTILELHCLWGNRWSRIAQHLPGRTDNEIKNYWRTRVQKQAKHLNWDVNSQQFRDTLRYVWMPRLAERIRASSGPGQPTATTNSPVPQSDSSNSLGTELQDGSGWCSEKVDWWGAEKSLMDLEMAETSVWNWSGDENISFLRQELFDESSFGDVQTSLT